MMKFTVTLLTLCTVLPLTEVAKANGPDSTIFEREEKGL